jgi:signal-transduction protein with cAMP-binding, CBS, and nucleotidyltransferase domain
MNLMRVGFDGSADVPLVATAAGWMDESPVAERMTPASAVIAVSPDTPCVEAEARAQANGMRHLLVTDGDQLLGILCRCDFYPEPMPEEPVQERMTNAVYALSVDSTITEAALAMARFGIGIMPVVDGGRVVGVVTRGDLRRAGVPEGVLGARACVDCGSLHGVREDSYFGIDHCLNCLDVLDALYDPKNLGEGD